MEDEIERMTEGTCRKQQKLQPIQSLSRDFRASVLSQSWQNIGKNNENHGHMQHVCIYNYIIHIYIYVCILCYVCFSKYFLVSQYFMKLLVHKSCCFFVKTETSRGKQTILNLNPVGHTGRAEIWKTSCKMEAQAPQMAQPHGHICNREAWIVETETIDVAEYFIYFICMYFHHLFGRHWWPDASADHNSAWRFGPRPLWGQEPKGLAISSMQRAKAEKAAYDWFDDDSDDWYTYI